MRQKLVMEMRINFFTGGGHPGAGQLLGFPQRPRKWVGRAFLGTAECVIAVKLLAVGGGLRSKVVWRARRGRGGMFCVRSGVVPKMFRKPLAIGRKRDRLGLVPSVCHFLGIPVPESG